MQNKEGVTMKMDNYTPSRFEAEGIVSIEGKRIPYRAISEDVSIYDNNGSLIGSMFTYTYLSDEGKNASRPVLFAFNGGPGSGSVWLHLGLLGPQRIALDQEGICPPMQPPYVLEDNPLCMLDICDIVLIDPIGTGFGILLDSTASQKIYGVKGDCAAMCTVIEQWLIRYDRWQSPKYILGESYGTMRAAVLADMLSGRSDERLYSISINGLIFMGNAIETIELSEQPMYHAVIGLPSMAAAKWYHSSEKTGQLCDFVEQAYHFAGTTYLSALFAGDALSPEAFENVTKQLRHFTGFSRGYLREHRLNVRMDDFLRLLLKEKGLDIGLYDARYTMPASMLTGKATPVGDDPAMGKYCSPFIGAMNGEMRKRLGITFARPYVGISFDVGAQWQYEEDGKTYAQHLSSAMRRNQGLRLMLASGCYDMITVMGAARYLATHSGLPQKRVWLREYPSGHMPYLGEASAAALAKDLRTFILGM